MKRTVQFYYQGVNATVLWTKIFQYRKNEFPNICLLAEIVLCMGVSNSTVEKGFSQLTAMLSDRRLSLVADTMEDLQVIRTNHLSWTEAERAELLETATTSNMASRRKLRVEDPNSGAKRARVEPAEK